MGRLTNMTYAEKLKEYLDKREKYITCGLTIEKEMIQHLKQYTNEKFTLTYDNPVQSVTLDCEGDLFNLEQIGEFCDKYHLDLIINNRLVTENHLEDTTTIKTKYLFYQKKPEED